MWFYGPVRLHLPHYAGYIFQYVIGHMDTETGKITPEIMVTQVEIARRVVDLLNGADNPTRCEYPGCGDPATHEGWERCRDGFGFRTGLRRRRSLCLPHGNEMMEDASRPS